MTWPKHRVVLLAILCLGLSLRLGHFWAIADTVFPELPLVLDQSDLYANVQWARTIVAGDWLGQSTYHPHFPWMRDLGTPEAWYRWWGGQTIFQQSPLYPYWVAGWFTIFGESLTGILFIQLVLGALDSLVIYCLARRLFDVRVGLVAAAMTALYGPYIFHQGTLLRDWLPPILDPLALLAILRARETQRARDWLLAGGTIGLALLAKESILLFLPLLPLWLITQYRHAWSQALRAGTALAVGVIIILTPLFVRNAVVGAPVFALSNRAAEGFIEGNAPDSRPVGFKVPQSLPAILERSQGHFTTVVYETLRLYQGDWLSYLSLLAFKLRGLADPFEVPNNLDYRYGQEISPVLDMTLVYGFIFPIGLAGLVLSLRTVPRHSLLLLYGLAILASQLLTIVLARYRLALVPVLIIYGAVVLVFVFDAVRQRHWPAGFAVMTLVAGCAILEHFVCPIPRLRTEQVRPHYYFEYLYSSKLYAGKKDYARAATELVRMRQRAAALPETAENLKGKAETISVALEREGYLRILSANQLFERGQLEHALAMVDLAKRAYVEHLRVTIEYLDKPVDPQIVSDVANTPLFFERLLEIQDDQGEAAAIRALLDRLAHKT